MSCLAITMTTTKKQLKPRMIAAIAHMCMLFCFLHLVFFFKAYFKHTYSELWLGQCPLTLTYIKLCSSYFIIIILFFFFTHNFFFFTNLFSSKEKKTQYFFSKGWPVEWLITVIANHRLSQSSCVWEPIFQSSQLLNVSTRPRAVGGMPEEQCVACFQDKQS